jgi:hypothetical protein
MCLIGVCKIKFRVQNDILILFYVYRSLLNNYFVVNNLSFMNKRKIGIEALKKKYDSSKDKAARKCFCLLFCENKNMILNLGSGCCCKTIGGARNKVG